MNVRLRYPAFLAILVLTGCSMAPRVHCPGPAGAGHLPVGPGRRRDGGGRDRLEGFLH